MYYSKLFLMLRRLKTNLLPWNKLKLIFQRWQLQHRGQMITRQELNPLNLPLTPIQSANLDKLFFSLTSLQEQYGHPLTITSGYRSIAHQREVDPAHPGSAHCQGAAVDILDGGKLWDFCVNRLDIMKDLGFYLENEKCAPGHLHLQIIAPASQNRIFDP